MVNAESRAAALVSLPHRNTGYSASSVSAGPHSPPPIPATTSTTLQIRYKAHTVIKKQTCLARTGTTLTMRPSIQTRTAKPPCSMTDIYVTGPLLLIPLPQYKSAMATSKGATVLYKPHVVRTRTCGCGCDGDGSSSCSGADAGCRVTKGKIVHKKEHMK
jgi:hypothetical protein